MSTWLEKAKALRQQAREALEFLRTRKRNYQLTFSSPAGQRVLEDLAKFCRAKETCFHADPRMHAVAEGRREVFLRIANHLNLSTEDLFRISSGNTVHLEFEEDEE